MLVASVFDDEFQNVIKHSNTDKELYIKAQQISQKYLEKELTEKEAEIVSVKNEASQKDSEIKSLKKNLSAKESIHTEQHQIIINKENQLEEQRRKLQSLLRRRHNSLCAEMASFTGINHFIQYLLLYIGLNFLWLCSNFTNAVTVFVETTSFGTHNENSMVLLILCRNGWRTYDCCGGLSRMRVRKQR